MGWTFTHRPKGISHKDFFQNKFDSTKTRIEVLDAATVNWVCYMAVKSHKLGKTFAVICLTRWAPKADYFNFGYKDMDESMQPFYYGCPKRILDLLDPLPPLSPQVEEEITRLEEEERKAEEAGDYERRWDIRSKIAALDPDRGARIWRQKCLEKVTKEQAKPKLRDGTVIRFRQRLRFTDGHVGDTFRVERTGKRRVFRSMDNGRLYRIGSLRRLEYEVVTK